MGKKVACLALSKTYNPVEVQLFIYHLSQYISIQFCFQNLQWSWDFRVDLEDYYIPVTQDAQLFIHAD